MIEFLNKVISSGSHYSPNSQYSPKCETDNNPFSALKVSLSHIHLFGNLDVIKLVY